MGWLFFLIAGSVVYSVVSDYFQDKKTKENTTNNSYITKESLAKDFPVENKESKTVVNNVYIQKNIYVQQNHYHNKSAEEYKDHSEKVWNKMGYRVKRGESCAYRFYGNEIFKPNQVEKASAYQVKYSEVGLAKKLLRDTGSISHARDILQDNYGLSKSKATNLLKYRL